MDEQQNSAAFASAVAEWRAASKAAPVAVAGAAKQAADSLLEGSVDERANRAAFASAVAEWRASGRQAAQAAAAATAPKAAAMAAVKVLAGSGDAAGSGSFLAGEFNEADSSGSFQEALQAWRSSKAPAAAAASAPTGAVDAGMMIHIAAAGVHCALLHGLEVLRSHQQGVASNATCLCE